MSRNGLRQGVWSLPVLAVALSLSGCSSGVDTAYGRSRSYSINGTGVFAGIVRDAGHEVRVAVRLTDELSDWADVIVRFATTPGPPPRDEAKWYTGWLNAAPDRRVVYVPHDYDSAPEYWSRVLEQLPKDAPERVRERVAEARDESKDWTAKIHPASGELATPEDWFATKPHGPDAPNAQAKANAQPPPAVKSKGQAKGKAALKTATVSTIPIHVCETLGGPWAAGIDAEKAALPVREVFKVDSEDVLLTGDGEAIVMSWTRFNDSRALVVANGSFLLNAAIAANPERRPLARRVVDWVGHTGQAVEGATGQTGPRHVAFVEGAFVMADEAQMPSVFMLLNVSPFGRVAAQLLVLGLVACLARAPRLGRPRPEEPSGADRPVAHPEALGALLARTGQAREARVVLESYRRWRSKPSSRGSGRESG